MNLLLDLRTEQPPDVSLLSLVKSDSDFSTFNDPLSFVGPYDNPRRPACVFSGSVLGATETGEPETGEVTDLISDHACLEKMRLRQCSMQLLDVKDNPFERHTRTSSDGK